MRNRPNLLHLLVVPIITIVVCNGITMAIVWQISSGVVHFWQNIGVLAMAAYSLYLIWRTQARLTWQLAAITCAAVAINYFALPILLWLVGVAVLFALVRTALCGVVRPYAPAFFKDFLAASFGLAVAFFLAPASLSAAVAAFVLVQLIYEFRRGETLLARPLEKDRFKESLRTAERVMDQFS